MIEERKSGVIPAQETSELISDRLIIEGGKPLEGRVRLSGAKNLTLQAITASIPADSPLTLTNVPRIADVDVTLSIMQKMGAKIDWETEDTLTCDCRNLRFIEIDAEESLKATGTRYFVPVLARRMGTVLTGPSGGDRLSGNEISSFNAETLARYEEMGLGHYRTRGLDGNVRYDFFPLAYLLKREMRQEERFFGPTVQALLFHAKGKFGEEFIIRNPCIEPEIGETIKLLNSMGAAIHQDQDLIYIASMNKLEGTTFRIMSDPNVLVSYCVMALITNGHVVIEGVDYSSKVGAFLTILDQMHAIYDWDFHAKSLTIFPSFSSLRSVDLETDFWPAQCHTDWQQILTPLLCRIPGESFIDENVYPSRFTHVASLSKMGANLTTIRDPDRIKRTVYKDDGEDKPHTLKIIGPCEFAPYTTRGPADIRGTTGLLAAMLCAKGVSILDGASQIQRGIPNLVSSLRALGASVSV